MISPLTDARTAQSTASDEAYMGMALALAHAAASQGEVPVGAILVRGGVVIGTGANQPIATHDPSAHAEIVCLRSAGAASSNYRLPDSTLYVTLEPCVMCAGAILHARIGRLVFGASDPKAGAAISVYDVISNPRLNHVTQWQGGVRQAECEALLKRFFRGRRGRE